MDVLDRISTKDHDYENLKASMLNWSHPYNAYRCVRAIPNYRVYQFYDNKYYQYNDLEVYSWLILGACGAGLWYLLCVSVTATYVFMSKVRHHRVPCRLLRFVLCGLHWKVLFKKLFSCQDDQRLGFLSTGNTPMLLDTTTNDIVYKPLARNDDYLKMEQLLWLLWLDGFLLTHWSWQFVQLAKLQRQCTQC